MSEIAGIRFLIFHSLHLQCLEWHLGMAMPTGDQDHFTQDNDSHTVVYLERGLGPLSSYPCISFIS